MEEMITRKAIIVGVCTKNEEFFNYEMKELSALCEACMMECVAVITQNLPSFNNATYVGSGKVFEIKEMVEIKDVDLVIFNDELTPAQLANLADVIECEIMDRTMLILEIFKTRARTKEATLQVELAHLNYMLPRLVGARKNLSRTGGGASGGAGARRGAGETKLELDRRIIEKRIDKLKSDLYAISLDRQTARKMRKKTNTLVVSFVGYTNAGKSSTINSLLRCAGSDVEKEVFVKDMLFATLDTSTRRIKLANNHEFLITDTVGFVNKLPHHLVESFKSTLEEITESSLIVHLIDASSPYMKWQIETTNEVLKKLGCSDIPIVYAYNKVDLVKNLIFIPTEYQPMLKISNRTLEGIDELLTYIESILFKDLTVSLMLPYTKGEIYNVLKEKAHISSTEYLNEGIKVVVTLSEYLYNLYQEYEIK